MSYIENGIAINAAWESHIVTSDNGNDWIQGLNKEDVTVNIVTVTNQTTNERIWKIVFKKNDNNNVVELVGPSGSRFTKIFTLAAILEDPETAAASDGNIEVEFNTAPAQ